MISPPTRLRKQVCNITRISLNKLLVAFQLKRQVLYFYFFLDLLNVLGDGNGDPFPPKIMKLLEMFVNGTYVNIQGVLENMRHTDLFTAYACVLIKKLGLNKRIQNRKCAWIITWGTGTGITRIKIRRSSLLNILCKMSVQRELFNSKSGSITKIQFWFKKCIANISSIHYFC